MRWLRRLSLRARITMLAAAVFLIAVTVGAVLLIAVLRYALIHELDGAADRTAADVAVLVTTGRLPATVEASGSGVLAVQVVDAQDNVISATRDGDPVKSILKPDELARSRRHPRQRVPSDRIPGGSEPLLVTAHPVGSSTVLVVIGLGRVEASQRILGNAAVVGVPLAVALLALVTWNVVGLALRPVAELRAGAQEITAADLADQRLPDVGPDDEIHRLAVTLNAMLDRIDTATTHQRRFIGDAAHELRSPLASVRVQLEVAARLGETDWPAVINDVLADVDRLDRLVGDLLVLARLDESAGVLARLERIDLAALAHEVAAGYRSARVPVAVHLRPLTVPGDSEALRRVLVNLLDNAVRHAAHSVRLDITSTGFEVIDDGPGIPVADRARVFDRFYRGDASRSRESGGTGLGLAIVRDLVRAHGGTVVLADADGPGLRVIVTLPVGSNAR